MSKHQGRLAGAADFLKASYVSRWGIVCVSKDQSIAEHMYRVWQLTRAWGPLANLTSSEQACAEEHALTHDLAEIRTGDCPTPFKGVQIREALSRIEESIYPSLPVTGRVKEFVKYCDTAEAILFLKLHGQGQHAADVAELLQQQMLKGLDESAFAPLIKQQLIEAFQSTHDDT